MSGTRSKAALQAALEVVDTSHIVWGSDFPANQNFKVSLNVITQDVLNNNQRNFLLGDNMQGLLG